MDDLNKRFPRYSKLLHFYPGSYRREYGEQMLQTLADMLDDPAQSHGTVWARTFIDFPVSVVCQQVVFTGSAMSATPRYIKRYAALGAWLVAPFFLFAVLSSLFGKRLYNSVFWHTNFLFTWLILLPILAILLNTIALLRWIQERRRSDKRSMRALLLDWRRNWPAVGIILIGLAILALAFGHDSVHCVSGNPVRELHNPRQTWQCIQQG